MRRLQVGINHNTYDVVDSFLTRRELEEEVSVGHGNDGSFIQNGLVIRKRAESFGEKRVIGSDACGLLRS